jgi:hypothetical protein
VTSSESTQHKRLKEIIGAKLKEWTGATLQEYPSSGHELDVFAVTTNGVSIYVEIIWSSSRVNFFRDMNMIQTSDANVKLVLVSPKILNKTEFQREFEKVAIAQRRLNFAMHGNFIDGERILKEPEYLNTEFKDIVLRLLNQVNVRGKAVGIQVELNPPKVDSANEVEEQLLSNLFPVKKYPEKIFASPTNIRYSREVYEKLGHRIKDIPFLSKDKKIYTFDNLRVSSSPFLSIISKDRVTEENVSDWLQDSVKRNDLMYLLNVGLKKYCENRGLYFDKKHNRFVCLLKDGETYFFSWKRKVRFVPRKIATCVKGKSGDVLYCKHYAASLRFMFLDKNIFLKIEPTMTFTYDGYKPIRSAKLASLMSRYLSKQYNSEYLDLVRFWGKFLSKLDVSISIPVGKETIEVDPNPIGVPTSIGIVTKRGHRNVL